MNRRLSKRVSKKALEISVEWLKSLLSDAEAAKVNAKHIPRDNPTEVIEQLLVLLELEIIQRRGAIH
mgnify:CR=1 FL=1